MLIAFSVPIWILTIVVFIVVVFLQFFMHRTKTTQQSFAQSCLNLLAIFLQQSSKIRKEKVSDVILSVALLVFTLNLVNIYTGRYASLRTVSLYGPSIDTIEELAESGLVWLQSHEAWVLSLVLSDNVIHNASNPSW